MGCVIDSCVLIGCERGKYDLADHVATHTDESLYLSVISASELLHGVHRAANPTIRHRRQAFVEEVLRQFPILEIDLTVARLHAEIWADLAAAGNLIGSHDLWIAASCIAGDHALLTDNAGEFSRVAGLQILELS